VRPLQLDDSCGLPRSPGVVRQLHVQCRLWQPSGTDLSMGLQEGQNHAVIDRRSDNPSYSSP